MKAAKRLPVLIFLSVFFFSPLFSADSDEVELSAEETETESEIQSDEGSENLSDFIESISEEDIDQDNNIIFDSYDQVIVRNYEEEEISEIYFLGNVEIRFGEQELKARKILITMQGNNILEIGAFGNVEFLYDGTIYLADSLVFDPNEVRGVMRNMRSYLADAVGGSIGMDDGFYYNAEKGKILDDDKIVLKNVTFTSSEERYPHYTLSARRLWIFDKNIMFAINLDYKVAQSQFLWVPFYFDWQQGTKLQTAFGQEYDLGWYIFNDYELETERGSVDLDFDIYQRQGEYFQLEFDNSEAINVNDSFDIDNISLQIDLADDVRLFRPVSSYNQLFDPLGNGEYYAVRQFAWHYDLDGSLSTDNFTFTFSWEDLNDPFFINKYSDNSDVDEGFDVQDTIQPELNNWYSYSGDDSTADMSFDRSFGFTAGQFSLTATFSYDDTIHPEVSNTYLNSYYDTYLESLSFPNITYNPESLTLLDDVSKSSDRSLELTLSDTNFTLGLEEDAAPYLLEYVSPLITTVEVTNAAWFSNTNVTLLQPLITNIESVQSKTNGVFGEELANSLFLTNTDDFGEVYAFLDLAFTNVATPEAFFEKQIQTNVFLTNIELKELTNSNWFSYDLTNESIQLSNLMEKLTNSSGFDCLDETNNVRLILYSEEEFDENETNEDTLSAEEDNDEEIETEDAEDAAESDAEEEEDDDDDETDWDVDFDEDESFEFALFFDEENTFLVLFTEEITTETTNEIDGEDTNEVTLYTTNVTSFTNSAEISLSEESILVISYDSENEKVVYEIEMDFVGIDDYADYFPEYTVTTNTYTYYDISASIDPYFSASSTENFDTNKELTSDSYTHSESASASLNFDLLNSALSLNNSFSFENYKIWSTTSDPTNNALDSGYTASLSTAGSFSEEPVFFENRFMEISFPLSYGLTVSHQIANTKGVEEDPLETSLAHSFGVGMDMFDDELGFSATLGISQLYKDTNQISYFTNDGYTNNMTKNDYSISLALDLFYFSFSTSAGFDAVSYYKDSGDWSDTLGEMTWDWETVSNRIADDGLPTLSVSFTAPDEDDLGLDFTLPSLTASYSYDIFEQTNLTMDFYSAYSLANISLPFLYELSSLSLTADLDWDFLTPTSSQFVFGISTTVMFSEFWELNFSTQIKNTKIHQYTADYRGDTGKTLWEDVWNGLQIWNIDALAECDFKVQDLHFDITHDLDEWELSVNFDINREIDYNNYLAYWAPELFIEISLVGNSDISQEYEQSFAPEQYR